METKRRSWLWVWAAQCVVGGIALALTTFVCFRLGVELPAVGFAYVILIALFFHFSGIQTTFVANMIQQTPQTLEMWRSMGVSPEALARMEQDLNNQAAISEAIFFIPKFFLLSVGTVIAVREVFRPSVVRAISIAMLGGIVS